MKKKFFFLSMLAALVMTGCTQDDIVPNEGNGDATATGETKTSYLSVNLMSADDTGTRAASNYENGTDSENGVTHVRFYFFTESGSPANVKLLTDSEGKTSYVNYYDWNKDIEQSRDDKENPDNNDVESVLSATIVINTLDGDKIPQRIAAVLNPSTDVLGSSPRSLASLKGIERDYADTELIQPNKFIMYNSVYADNTTEVNTTFITASNLATSIDDAKENPVKIYVERSVAKVRASLSSSIGFNSETGLLALKDSKNSNLLVEGNQVYLKISNWSLTADTDKGRLVKDINPEWEGKWWNGPSYIGAGTYRSFWAINASSAKNQYHTYDDIKSTYNSDTELYTNENAESSAQNDQDLNHTKVILKGQLCDKEGNGITLVRHLGAYFVDSEGLPLLKKSILAQLVASGRNYYNDVTETKIVDGETVTVTGTKRVSIKEEDIEIVVRKQQQKEESDNNCYVRAKLTKDAAAKTWYMYEDEDAEPLQNAESIINETFANTEIIDKALVWNTGMTYYYYEILHKGVGTDANLMPGVVRNHIYDTKVTKIAGLGTPVYDPTEKIYPEKPKNNDHYIAAEIEILSWRIVKNDYELEW